MAFVSADFVRETTTSTGTGAITLGGTTGREPARAFSSVLANGDTFKYAISDAANNAFEVGIGTYTSGTNSFTRVVESSSNSNAAVTFAAGAKNVDMVLSTAQISTFFTGGTAARSDILTGTNTAKAATPDAVAAIWEKGADNSGGATITLGDGYQFDLITSTTTITAVAFTTDKAGRRATLRFATARQVTHNATSLISPTAGNLAMGVGDLMEVESLGSGNFRILWFNRADVAQTPGVLSITASTTQITNATTNVSCGVFTIPANTLRVGSVYRLTGLLAFVHTAAATPTLTAELVVGGTVVVAAINTPPATALTYGVWATGWFTCRTTGSSGTINCAVGLDLSGSAAATSEYAVDDGVTDTVNTTTALTLELRVRMTTAIISNSLRANQGFIEKVM